MNPNDNPESPAAHRPKLADPQKPDKLAKPEEPGKPARPDKAPSVPQARLPHAQHAERLPPGVSLAEVLRLREAAWALPQVLTPGDWSDAATAEAERALDQAGFVQLQRGAGTARPSRWIAPDLLPQAVQHLDAVGGGPPARALKLQRQAELEALSLVRRGGQWQRQAVETLVLGPGARVPVHFRHPLDETAVWRYFRDGDAAALQAALGPAPAYPQREALLAHLQRLVERSDALSPRQLPSLWPRLQAACATPLPLAELQAACSRAQDRWEHAVAEADTLERLHHDLAFQGYPDSFAAARRLQRRVRVFVGPPNSGKTHAAFERLAQALDGAYLAPLRLLALEGRDRLVARGVPCSLRTGEENVPAEGARVISSTIEMVDTRSVLDVAVIDEAQMLFDSSRGWAWTQAIVGVPARELIIICSAFAVPAVQQLAALCGETVELRHFERKQHVQQLPRPVPLWSLEPGDAVVAFSRREVLRLRDAIAQDGTAVSVIYGALPPEVRRREAERFATGASQVLVATDAIGMGLNLPIRRVIFSTLEKFDGVSDRPLGVSEVHQIAGRAGRFGLHEEGFAGVLKDAEGGGAKLLAERLAAEPRAPRDFKAPVAPNTRHIETIAERLGQRRLRAVLDVFMQQLKLDDAHFAVAELEGMLQLADELDRAAAPLSLMQRFLYAQAPVDLRADQLVQAYLDWAHQHARLGHVGRPQFLDEVDGHSRLDRMEQALRACTLWLWLDLRFEGVYGHVEEVLALRSQLNDGIERTLKSKRPLAMLRPVRRPR